MKIFTSIADYQKWRNSLKENQTVGLVPTMGALHEGHSSLFRKAIQENDFCVGTIFVNPTQFDNAADFEKYPNTQEADVLILSELGCQVLLIPKVEEVYPPDFKMTDYDLDGLDKYMEGAYRKGHFGGMVNVVKRLFMIGKPTKSYFGEKDFQQLQIIRKLVEIEAFDIEIIGCPIVRNENNLALSSRNKRLSKEQLDISKVLYKTLFEAKKKILDTEITDLQAETKTKLANLGVKLEYLNFCEENELKPLIGKPKKRKNIRAFIAAYLGEIRLIDNLKMY